MFTIDFTSSECGLCETICNEIRKEIFCGKLEPNERLPSKRALAEHLGVSVITVQNAYSELIAEGYIYSIEKKGFFVTDLADVAVVGRSKNEIQSEIQNTSTEKNARQEKKADFLADFSSNSTNPKNFPFSLWAHLMRKVLTDENLKSRILERVNVSGVWELRLAISEHLRDFRNMNVSPNKIVIVSGTESACSMIVQLLGNEKIYAVENPGYHKVAKVFSLNGANVIPIKIDEFGVNPCELEKINAKVVHVSPSHHFPTGIIMPARRRFELLSWAEKNDAYIIEDEYDSEFRLNGKPLPSLLSSNNSRVIYMNTFSKTLTPSFRISYMILPDSLVEKFNEKLGFYSCSVSAFEQFALAKFIECGFYEKHIIRMKNYYRNLRNNFISALNSSSLKDIVVIHEENSGLHFLLRLKNDSSDEKNSADSIKRIHARLLKEKINIQLLSDFFYDDENDKNFYEKNFYKDSFVLNYSGIEREKIPEIVKKMENAFADVNSESESKKRKIKN
ncbi:MAG: PLP-dependent aminotransferase family protein [Treponema sp.]|nr:PLP-dependent aminotransferase family protein [Treponema sp.]